MQQAESIVRNLSNAQAVTLLKQLNRDIYQAIPYKEVTDKLVKDVDEVLVMQNLDVDVKKQNLDPKASLAATRQVLMMFATDEDLAPILVQTWEDIRTDDSLFVEAIVPLGLIVNLTLFMVTTEFDFTIGKLRVKKGRADSAMIKEILSPVVELVKKITL
jgi:hypothetical protein